MTLKAGEILQVVRDYINEPTPVRFPDSQLLRFLSNAMRQLAFDIDYPEDSLSFPVAGTQEYQLPEINKILRVYVAQYDPVSHALLNKIPVIATDIPTLEGQIQETWDVSYQNNSQTNQLWMQQTQMYPVQHRWNNSAVPQKSPFSQNPNGIQGRPMYYMRGGNIGFTIPPMYINSGSEILVDCVLTPADVTNLTDNTPFTANCKMALVWKTAESCYISDNASAAVNAAAKYQEQKGILHDWFWGLQAGRAKALVPVTYRNYLNQARGRRYNR